MRVDVRDQQARLNVFGQSTTSERARRTALLPFSLAAIAAIALAWGCYLLFSYGRPIELDSTKVVAAAPTADPGVTREDFQRQWEAQERSLTDHTQARAAELVQTRALGGGMQWDDVGLRAALHVPTGTRPAEFAQLRHTYM